MRIRYRLGLGAAMFVLGVAPALVLAAGAGGKSVTPAEVRAAIPRPNASTPAKDKAYGKDCQAESKKHIAGQTGTPFSQCVTAMVRLATNKSMTPAHACAGLSKKHVAGMKGTPYSQCVMAAAHLRRGKKSGTAPVSAMAVAVPQKALEAHAGPGAACTLPDGSGSQDYHCYTPQDIRAYYGVDQLTDNYGQGQTIVLVDSYGSPTAAADLQRFHDVFFPSMPNPSFQQIFPLGNPQYNNTCTSSKGKSGPCAAAGWSGEATLDIEWAYSIAPEAHIILLAVPPAETEGVQGFPNLFKAISSEIAATPPGTVFSMSFGATEQTFGGAGPTQTAKFDQVFQQGLAKDDNFFAATGDYGSQDFTKQAKNNNLSTYPAVDYPSTSPYVVAVGGTQLQYNWTWDPTSNDPSTSGYWNWIPHGTTEAVWNESWAPIGTGGGSSVIYAQPSWQKAVGSTYGNHRLVPDTAWNAAVNGGVDVYITAYPQYNCGNTTGCWSFYGGTSAATPQTAALVALVNSARAAAHKQPIGFLDPILYQDGVGASDYTDIQPVHEGSAPKTFAGSEIGVSDPVYKSVGDLEDNQLWESSVPGYPTTASYDATTGWGTPNAPKFVAALSAMP
jgi:subtilase family serine protease